MCKMGNEHTTPITKTSNRRSHSPDKVLYSIVFKSGEIIEHEEKKEKNNGIAIELILHCEKGDLGPLPMSQLKSEEERTIDMWSTDHGKPKYCIIIMYREKENYFPQWSILYCKVKIVRQTTVYESLFKHEMPISGGSANVYSLTMSPSQTSNQTATYGAPISKKD